jgi:hypothetical protein
MQGRACPESLGKYVPLDPDLIQIHVKGQRYKQDLCHVCARTYLGVLARPRLPFITPGFAGPKLLPRWELR